MSKTFNSTYSNLTLSNPSYNPVYVASSATITGTITALYGKTIFWTVTNAGTIAGGPAQSDVGIWLHEGGVITNQSTGTITADYAIELGNESTMVSTVVNYGSIGGVGTAFPKAIIIDHGGAVTNHMSAVISGGGGIYFGSSPGTVVNAGLIAASGGGSALDFNYGGLVSNASTGTISAESTSIYLGNSGIPGFYGTLINDGLISTTAFGFADVFMGQGSVTNMSDGQILGTAFGIQIQSAPAIVVNAGSIGASAGQAIALLDGGYVTNATSGNISGSEEGVYARGLPGTVINSGIIQAPVEIGIFMLAGGSVSNASSAAITGGYQGVAINNGGTVTNDGTIIGTIGNGVYLNGTASLVTNSAGATITGGNAGIALRNGAYADNAGYVYGSNYGATTNNSLLTNQAGGVIKGGSGGIYLGGGTLINSGSVVAAIRNGVYAGNAGGVVTNQTGGHIIGYNYGVRVNASTTIVNDGTISDSGTGPTKAIYLAGGGAITNQSAGLITSATGIQIKGAAGSVVNAGIVTASTGRGIYMYAGGRVTNLAGGMIAGGTFGSGVQIEHGGTIANAGTIEATTGNDAVYFEAGYTNLLVTDPGAVFVGSVDGGNPVGGTASSTLELGSGSIAGTLSGLGSQYINFDNVVVDPGATWTFAGSSVVYSGVTMTNSGSVDGPVVMQANAVLTNASGATITGGNYAVDGSGGGILVDNAGLLNGGAKAVRLSGGGTVDNRMTGTIQGSSYAVLFDGAPGTVDNAGHITASLIGVYLYAGGQFTNEASGTVMGGGQALSVDNGIGTAVNAGALIGGNAGIVFNNGGAVTNEIGGFITATANGGYGIVIRGGAGTVVNAGGIAGYEALAFAPGFANRLALYPSGLISGPVTGGNAIGATAISTLELASGASEGTLSGFGTQFTDFAQVSVDTGAVWTITSAISAGVTLTNSGSLDGTVLLAGGASLTNNATGLITAASGSAVYESNSTTPIMVNNAGTILQGGTEAALLLQGTASVSNANNATIIGGSRGVDIAGAASVSNAGSIGATASNGVGIAIGGGGQLSNASSGVITGQEFGVYLSGGGSITNDGSIGGAFIDGIGLSAGGSISNDRNAIITGYFEAIQANNVAANITNDGTILDTNGSAIVLSAGGSVTNQSNGAIWGQDEGVGINMTPATVVNQGSINGASNNGVGLFAGGLISNATGATITGYGGAQISGGAGTVMNAGSIGATGNYALRLSAGFSNLLTIDPGASFTGRVDGGNTIGATAVSTLELASGASTGTLNGLGSQYIDFAQVTIDAGANWTLNGSSTITAGETLTVLSGASATDTGTLLNDGGIVLDPSTMLAGNLTGSGEVTIGNGSTLEVQGSNSDTIAFAGGAGYLHLDTPDSASGTVTNFATGDTIDLKGIDSISVSLSSGNLQFAGGSFPLPGVGAIQVTPSADGADVSVLCFCVNTLIQTPSGQVAVQHLAIGDAVLTLSGVTRRIVWIGTGKVLATRGHRTAATPVIVRKSALADNVPNRDLHLTKGHSLYLDGVLIPVESLINHRSIVWDDRAQEVELYHIELESHDVLIANGAPAESYRDDGNRWLFRNANSGWDSAPLEPCAPILSGGELVDAEWRRLLDRAGPRPRVPTTDDPDLHLLVDGQRVDAISRHGEAYVFALCASPEEVRIVSRAAAPDQLGVARDPRVLGAALRQIALRNGTRFRVIKAADERLAEGFHAFEPQAGLRWTNGDAVLPMMMFHGLPGPMELVLHVGCTSTYLPEAEISVAA